MFTINIFLHFVPFSYFFFPLKNKVYNSTESEVDPFLTHFQFMEFEISSARIRLLQEGLRREAGLSSYEPADSSPQLPSIRDLVAALDPDLSPSLRCERCRGGLLRGLQSTICIYCGHDRRKEGLSHSISFNSTVGCRKLLDFLGLDGSVSKFLVFGLNPFLFW